MKAEEKEEKERRWGGDRVRGGEETCLEGIGREGQRTSDQSQSIHVQDGLF
jgi:hypothetical protein